MPISQDQFDQITKSLPAMGKDPHSVRQRVEEILGSSGVLSPKGTETLRITLKTLATARFGSSNFGIALA